MKNSMLILTLMVAALCGCAAQQPTNLETPESSVLVEVTPETSSEATPTATPAPTPDPTPVPTAEPTATPTPIAAPTAKPTPAPTEAPAATAAPVQQAEASQQVSMSYGAVPFDLAAGTDQWWSIDSSDSAYWAVAENINAMRAAAGLPALTVDGGLSSIANSRCDSFASGGSFDHSGAVCGEIIAAGPFASASSVCAAWQSSPDHYASIVSPNYSSMGIGCWFCSTEAGQYTYWAVTFMKFYDTARSNKSTHFLLLIKYSLFSIPFWNTSKKQGISPIIHKSVPTGKTTVIST